MTLHRSWHRTALGMMLAILVLAGCTSEAEPSPSPSGPAPSSPPPSVEPSRSPSEQPAPSEPTTIGYEPASVPESRNASGGVAVMPGGDGLVAIGFDGGFGSILWTSADEGRTWTDITPAGFESIGIASVIEHDGTLIAVGRGDTINVEAQEAAVYLSEDGTEWRKVDTAEQLIGQMIDLVATDDGLYAVGGVPGADSAGIWLSPDGETWERTGGDLEHAFIWAIAEGGPGLVAVGWRRNPDPDLAVWTSTDGVEWTLTPDPEGFAGYEATDVLATDEGTLVMVGSRFDGGGGQFWTSDDGVEWTLAEVEGGLDEVYARTLTPTPAGVVAVGGGADMAARAWISTDGRAWRPIGEPLEGAYFHAALATENGLILTGATQAGAIETGIEAHAQIWIGTFTD